LRAARASLGLTQMQMAELCGVAQPNYAAWESGAAMSRSAVRVVELLVEIGPRRVKRMLKEIAR
jgi:transcriptional regulator with XRE-family HTH domain